MFKIILALLLLVTPASAQYISLSGSSGGGGGSGTVTSVSVVSANGFAGTVATATTTPAITLTTTVTGNVCSNATALSACTTTGTGSTVLQTTPTLITPVLGVATGTSLALGGATISSNALAVTGTIANTQTWNSGGTTFQGISAAITNTASAAASNILQLLGGAAGATNIFSVRASDGQVNFGTAFLFATSSADIGFYTASQTAGGAGTNSQLKAFRASPIITILDASGNRTMMLNRVNGGIELISTALVGWNASTTDAATSDTVLSRNAAGIIQFGTTAANASGAWLAAKGTLTGGTLADQAQVLAITATQPASPTGTQNAILTTVTGAGSASQTNYAHKLLYSAGYTGTSFNAALNVVNTNAGSLSSGLFVGLADTTPAVGAALIVDNGAVALPIFLARDNGSTVFTIADGGQVTIAAGLAVNSTLTVGTSISAGAANGILWTGRAIMWSSADSIIRFTNQANNDFDRLQLGGTTSSFPAIKRSTTVLQFKLADDSAFTSFTATTGILNTLATDAGQTTATVCAENTTGQLYKGSGTVGICLGTSSARYKNRINDLTAGLSEIEQLQPKRFWYNKDAGDNGVKEQVGFMAEDVVKVLPNLVGLDSEGRPNTLDLVGMIPVIIKAIQELKADNDNLRASLNRRAANGG